MTQTKSRPITKSRMIETYNELDGEYPDKSFNWLIAMTADALNADEDVVLDVITDNIFDSSEGE